MSKTAHEILPAPLAALQQRAEAAFARSGLPRPTQEDWHYTRLDRFWQTSPAGKPPPAEDDNDAASAQLARQMNPNRAPHWTWRNKQFHGRPQARSAAPLIVRPLGEALAASERLRTRWAARARADIGAAMAGLNLAALDAALYVQLDAGAAAELCVEWQGGGQARLVLDLGAGAQLRLSEVGAARTPQNIILDGWLQREAQLAHRKLVRAGATHISAARLDLAARAQLEQDVLLLGRRRGRAQLTRHETHLRISGRGARATLRGYDLAAGAHQSELVFASEHRVRGGNVDMRSRHVLWDAARSVFHGRVEIAPHAVATDARQHARALLRSPDAEMDARPELRIHADDVACAHGVSIGELDRDALFYLRQRGLDERTASQLLLEAFLMDAAPAASLWTREQRARLAAVLLANVRRLERRAGSA